MCFSRLWCVVSLLVVLTIPAYGAVSKCTALGDSSSSCTFGSGTGLDWSGSCTTAGVSASLTGIAICAETSASFANTTNELSLSSTLDDNLYCWCKLITPLVSAWVAIGQGGRTYSECAMNCAGSCATNLRTNSSLKNTLLRAIIAD